MKKIMVSLAIVVVLLVGALQFRAVQGLLIGWYLPAFPHWPAPVTELAANANGEIYYQTATVFDLDVILNGMQGAVPTTGLGYLSVPKDASAEHRVPAMVILPGSGGISPGRESEYAKLLNQHGIAAFVVEYYEPRGMTKKYSYMLRAGTVTEFDLVTDAYSALKLLSTSPVIDPAKIGLMGFSYGGMATRHAMDSRIHAALAPQLLGFALHADFYGPCFQKLGTTKTNGAPLLTLRGTADNSNDLSACEIREKELAAIGVAVEHHTFEGAGHAWENSEPQHMNDAPYLAGCEIDYDAQGYSSIGGVRLTHNDPETTRYERLAARLTSGAKFKTCLHHGYTVGRNEAATQGGYVALVTFLEKNFQLAGNNATSTAAMNPSPER